jgi:hypothetical protein
LGLQFTSSVAGCLRGVRYLLVNASATVVVEAFNSTRSLVGSSSQVPDVAGFVQIPFAGPGIDVPANTAQYVSARSSLLWSRYNAFGFNIPLVNGVLTCEYRSWFLLVSVFFHDAPVSDVNSWYQEPSYTNPVVLHNFENTDYFVEPIFCPGSCASQPYITVTAPNTAVSWAAAVAHTISYSTNVPSSSMVMISLSTDGGVTFGTIIAASTPCTGTYVWTPGAPLSSTCRIKVLLISNPAVFDESDVNFSIVSPITITYPTTTPPLSWGAGALFVCDQFFLRSTNSRCFFQAPLVPLGSRIHLVPLQRFKSTGALARPGPP